MYNQFTHPWEKADVEYLRENYQKKSYKEIGLNLGRTYSSVQSQVRNLKINKRISKHSINFNFFKIYSSEMAYVLGFITADGNIYKSKTGFHIDIACDDSDIIEKIKISLNSTTITREKKRENGKISYSLRFSDKNIYNDLLSLGITPRKSLAIKPPLVPKAYIRDYIRGFFDGDGSVSIYNRPYPSKLNTVFYSASYSMATFIYELLVSVLTQYKAKIIVHKKQNPYYAIHCGQKHSEQLFHYMYDNATIYMERKYNIFLKGLHHAY